MRTTLDLDDDVLQRAKELAAARGRTLTALVEQGLREVLRAAETRAPYDLRMPTVCGDGPPSVDVTDRDRLLEVMDDRDPGDVTA